jgi:hypothetical protein
MAFRYGIPGASAIALKIKVKGVSGLRQNRELVLNNAAESGSAQETLAQRKRNFAAFCLTKGRDDLAMPTRPSSRVLV